MGNECKIIVTCDPATPPDTIRLVDTTGKVWEIINIGEETMGDSVRKRVEALIELLTARPDLKEIEVDHKDGHVRLAIKIVRFPRFER